MDTVSQSAAGRSRPTSRQVSVTLIIGLAIFGLAAILPLLGNDYWTLIGTRAAIYWILISGLNLIVGFAGQLAIGYVALLTLGAYTTSVLVAGTVMAPLPIPVAFAGAAVVGAVFGVIVGLPALRLRTFYFAITTLGFATIVTQIALAWQSVTGGGIGISGPYMPGALGTTNGLFYLSLALAAIATVITANVAASRFGRSLIAVRDAEVAAESCGISKPSILISVFIFAGAVAGIAGGLFASLQTYITPDAFTFELSVLFFIAVLIGGRGSIVGPLVGTIVLTVLPEIAAPLAAWSNFLYALLLLVIVLAAPGGIAALLDFGRRPIDSHRDLVPQPTALDAMSDRRQSSDALVVADLHVSFGGVRALDGVDLTIEPHMIHGLIGPNGSGKTTMLNVISGYNAPESGEITLGHHKLPELAPARRAKLGIARTFQTPRVIGDLTVIENIMIGGTITAKAGFFEALLTLPRSIRDERHIRERAEIAMQAVGLAELHDIRADRLKHSELRFLEIARALVIDPAFLLLDEPAAGLSTVEIKRLGELLRSIARRGVGVLLVEHHADLIFDVCDQITVFNLGSVLARGTSSEVRANEEVVSVYLGG